MWKECHLYDEKDRKRQTIQLLKVIVVRDQGEINCQKDSQIEKSVK